MNQNDINDLIRLKKTLEESKENKAKKEGRISSDREQLESIIGTSDIKKANKKLEEKNQEIASRDTKINNLLNNLREEYSW